MTAPPAATASCPSSPAGWGPVVPLAVAVVRRVTGVSLPPEVVAAAFRLFGLRSSAGQLRLLWRMVASPDPAMRRLCARAVRAVADYRAIVRLAPDLRTVMKLDFTILLGLYSDALGISREWAVAAGLVEAYCHLAALVDAYDDLLDTAEARRAPLCRDDFLTGPSGLLRRRLVEHLAVCAQGRPAVAGLVDDLGGFEERALLAHLTLDLATGLDAPLEAVMRARAATSGLLLRFAAHIWSVLLDLPTALAASSEQAAATFGVVAQFADDVIDWATDDGVAQNLLGAALLAYPDELAAARAAARRRPGWSLPVATLCRVAPRSLAYLESARQQAATYPADPRYDGLRRFGDDVYAALLPRLPAINFGEFDGIRQDVQRALGELAEVAER